MQWVMVPVSTFIEGLIMAGIYSRNMQPWVIIRFVIPVVFHKLIRVESNVLV